MKQHKHCIFCGIMTENERMCEDCWGRAEWNKKLKKTFRSGVEVKSTPSGSGMGKSKNTPRGNGLLLPPENVKAKSDIMKQKPKQYICLNCSHTWNGRSWGGSKKCPKCRVIL